MIFTSDEVNHRQITSRVTKKSLFRVTNVLFYFLHAILCPEHTISLKNNRRSFISPLSPRNIFSDLALWRHHSWSLTSREREVLALWRHIRRLFFHAQIGAKAIFTGEKQPSGIHGLACKKLYYLINIHSLSCHVWYVLKWLFGGSYYITCNILTWKEHPKLHLLLDLIK